MVVARKQEISTEPNTLEWRERVRAELERRGRGAQAAMRKDIGISSAIDNYLWPPLLPPASDTNEIRYLIESISEIDRDLLRLLKDMDRESQRKLAETIIAMRRLGK